MLSQQPLVSRKNGPPVKRLQLTEGSGDEAFLAKNYF
jgi:hypothetical protein